MFRRAIAIATLGILGLTLAIPVQKTKANDEVEEISTISQYEIVAGICMVDEVFIEKVKENKETLSKKDFELICRTVYCEAGNQDIKTQEMVALTILNRARSKLFPNTIKDVVYQKNAYEVTTWKNFKKYKWTKQVEKAVKEAIKSKTYPKNMYYFRTKHYHKFGKPYKKSGDLWFSTQN